MSVFASKDGKGAYPNSKPEFEGAVKRCETLPNGDLKVKAPYGGPSIILPALKR